MKIIVHYVPDHKKCCEYCGKTMAFISQDAGHAFSSSLPWLIKHIIEEVHSDYIMCSMVKVNHLESELFDI
jgi:hypothetical protein